MLQFVYHMLICRIYVALQLRQKFTEKLRVRVLSERNPEGPRYINGNRFDLLIEQATMDVLFSDWQMIATGKTWRT